jgi:hypothetical protein
MSKPHTDDFQNNASLNNAMFVPKKEKEKEKI